MGGQKGIALFYTYLSRLLPVTMISTGSNEKPAGLNINFLPVLSNSKTRYINPFLLFTIGSIIKKNKCTHLVLEHPYYGWLGMLLKSFYNVTLVIHSHNIEFLRFKSTGRWWWPVLRGYEKMTHRAADINFFINDEDRDFAIKHFSLNPSRTHTVTYGFDLAGHTSEVEKESAKKKLQHIHSIGGTEKILFFNGTLDYKPNQDAVDVILEHINPLLLNSGFKYKIIICGKGLPESYKGLRDYASKNIIYAGFVDDINLYFKGADVFINPVTGGGGIKTKMVEALGYSLSCVSTASGAIGIPPAITGNKMMVVADDDWKGFVSAIEKIETGNNIPSNYFEHFYWGNIAEKVSRILENNNGKQNN